MVKPSRKATVLAAVSAALIGLIYVTPSPEVGVAGAAFIYNFLFFFPAVLVSFAFWTAAIAWYVRFVRRASSKSALSLIAPPILLLPFTCQALYITFLVVSVCRDSTHR
jgi:purine-cytosine permease-like protein